MLGASGHQREAQVAQVRRLLGSISPGGLRSDQSRFGLTHASLGPGYQRLSPGELGRPVGCRLRQAVHLGSGAGARQSGALLFHRRQLGVQALQLREGSFRLGRFHDLHSFRSFHRHRHRPRSSRRNSDCPDFRSFRSH